MTPRRSIAYLAPALLLLTGCVDARALLDDRAGVLDAVRDRAEKPFVPEMVNLTDGLSEGEAVQLALLNNAAFQELLADLGLANADLVQAGLLTNPEVVYTWPAAGKPYRYLFDLPVEAIWLRPHRVDAATAEVERARERLTQAGLDLVRDTRVAYADWSSAHERQQVAEESLRVRSRIAALTEERYKA
jgi:outer membrane protein, heavy metal efflux system